MATVTKTDKTHKETMVTAVFRNRSDAYAAYDWLVSKGYRKDEINVMMSENTRGYVADERKEEGSITNGNLGVEGVATGGTIGTVIGATAAAIAAIGTSIVVPGLGFAIAGPLVAALTGAGAGALTGGLIGGLIGMGIPESNASAYEAALKEGGIALGVVPHNDHTSIIKDKFEEMRGDNVITA